MFDGPKIFDTYVEKIPIDMKRKFVFYEISYWEHINTHHLIDPMHIFKIFHLLHGGTYHRIKETHWLLGDILLLQILKRDIGQETKLEEMLVSLVILKKVMSHGF